MHGVAVEVLDGGKAAAPMHSPGMARCAAPLRSVFAGTSFAPPRRRLVSTITGRPITPEDDLAGLLAGQVTRPVLFAQAMAQAAGQADLIVTAGPDAGLTARAAECGGVPAVPIPVAMPGPGRGGPELTQALAALFAAGALTDLTPFLVRGRLLEAAEGTLARRTVPRMREAEPPPEPPAGPGLPPSGLATPGTWKNPLVR
jgi:enediyne polyketide synthase